MMLRRYFSRLPLVAAVAVVILAGESKGQIKDDQAALATLKVPDGFEIRLFAGADLCSNPTAIDVDVYGRVWVTEGVNYRSTFNKGPGPLDPEADRIKVLEDTDGDGKADRVTVFTDKLRIVPMTVCVAGDRVYTSVSPDLLVWEGAAAAKPSARNPMALLTGFGNPKGSDHDHVLHGLTLGPDGRLYFAHGDVGFSTVDKSGVAHKPRGGSMVRLNLDGSRMRVLADNFRNPYEPGIDSFGRVFCSDNDDDGNAQVRICYVVDGGDYGYRFNPKLPPSPSKHHWREDVPGVTPKILRTFAGSPCGLLVYEGKLLPERFYGSLIHCDNGAPQVVRAYHLRPAGAGFTCEIENLVTSSDKWFRPADVACAADGSLYICDWYDSGVGGHGYRDKVLGRIYHLTLKGAPPPTARYAPPDLKTVPGLISALMSPVPAIRFLAIQGLRQAGPEATAALTKLARDGKHPLERARALWVLWGMGDAGRQPIVERLQDPNPLFRAQAVRMLREDTDRNLDLLLPLAADPHPEVRLELAIALRDVLTARARAALVKLAQGTIADDDLWLPPTLAATYRQREPDFVRELFAQVQTPADEKRALSLAWQINRVESVPFLTGVLQSPKAPEHFARALEALGWIGDASAGEAVLTAAVREADPARVRAALEVLRRKISGDWKPIAARPAFAELFQKCQKDPSLLAPMLSLLAAAQAQSFVPKVLELVDDGRLDPAVRRIAVESLGQFRTADSLARLTAILKAARVEAGTTAPARPTDELALTALASLHAMSTPDSVSFLQGLILDRAYPADLRRQAVRLVGQSPAGCLFLLDAARNHRLPADLKGEATQLVHRSPDKKVRELALTALPLPKLANRTLPPLSELLSKNGDPKKGQAVYFKTEAQCAKCHRVAGVGAWVGPDLSQVGGKFAKDGLLDAILNPSSAIGHEYVQYVVETTKGQLFQGLIVEDATERLVLKNAEGERIVLPAKEVASKSPLQVSIMPENLVQALTDQELIDLLAYLGTLRQPAVTVPAWQLLGPFPADAAAVGPEKQLDLKASYPGKDGGRVSWRRLPADREGRIDLEAALGTRQASAYLYAPVQSRTEQAGRLVLLVPPGAKVAGWLNGQEIQFQLDAGKDPRQPLPASADLHLRPGKNDLLLRVGGSSQSAWTAVATLVSPHGVELP